MEILITILKVLAGIGLGLIGLWIVGSLLGLLALKWEWERNYEGKETRWAPLGFTTAAATILAIPYVGWLVFFFAAFRRFLTAEGRQAKRLAKQARVERIKEREHNADMERMRKRLEHERELDEVIFGDLKAEFEELEVSQSVREEDAQQVGSTAHQKEIR